jgi:hypothetical protein
MNGKEAKLILKDHGFRSRYKTLRGEPHEHFRYEIRPERPLER